MWSLSYRIYASANAAIFVLLLVLLLFSPSFFLFALFASLSASLPTIPALYGTFWAIQRKRVSVPAAWAITILSTCIISLMPGFLLSIFWMENLAGDGFFLLVSIAAGLAGICLQIPSIHYFFQKIESNSFYEND